MPRDTRLLEPERFRVVALADLSINVFATEVAVGKLLRAAKHALHPEGVLCLPVLDPTSLETYSRLRGMTAVPFTDDTGRQRLLWLVLPHSPDGPHFEQTLFVQDDNAPDGSIRGHVTAVRERLWTAETPPTATLIGDVEVAAHARVLSGAVLDAEGLRVTVGEYSIIGEYAVLRVSAVVGP
jgi:hypothetical protein